jgi:NADPH:quinone reductase-like Zn-dependent oxidoreductase
MVAWVSYRGGKAWKGGTSLMTTEDPPNRGDVPRRAAAGFTTLPHVFQVLVLGSWVSRTGSKKIGLMETAKPNKIDLVFIKELLEADKIVPVIDRTYPLSEVPEAIRYLEAGHAKGKVVITLEQNDNTSL